MRRIKRSLVCEFGRNIKSYHRKQVTWPQFTPEVSSRWLSSGRTSWVSRKVITRIISWWSPRSPNTGNWQCSTMGTPPKFGWKSGVVALLSREPAISLKQGKIGPKLLLMANRKLHTRFRLVPKSMTFYGHYALHCTKHASFGAYNENVNADRPILWRPAWSPMTSFLRYKFYVDSRWVLLGGASNDSGVIEDVDFQCILTLNHCDFEYSCLVYPLLPDDFVGQCVFSTRELVHVDLAIHL